MKGYLGDTNIALRATAKPESLSKAIQRALLHGPLFISALTYWEVVVKVGKNKLDVGNPKIWWAEMMAQLNANQLSFRPEHAAGIYDLPNHHNDPFDRALIAQAIAEDLQLLSTDTEMPKYKSAGLKLIS